MNNIPDAMGRRWDVEWELLDADGGTRYLIHYHTGYRKKGNGVAMAVNEKSL